MDGVPSCTADAIDRNTLQATKVLLVPTSRLQNMQRNRFRRLPYSSRRSRYRASRVHGHRSRAGRSYRRLSGERRRLLEASRSLRMRSRSRRSVVEAINKQVANIKNERKKRCTDCINEQEVNRRSTRSTYPTASTLTVDSGESPSLLVSTDNRCRYLIK